MSETFEDLCARVESEQTLSDILDSFDRIPELKLYGDGILDVAKAIKAEAVRRIDQTSDPDAQLQIARAAMRAFDKAAVEGTERYCAEQRKTWEPERRALVEWVESGKVGVKPAWSYPTAAELGGSSTTAQGIAPVVDAEGDI